MTVMKVRPAVTFSGSDIFGYNAATTVFEATLTVCSTGPIVAVAFANDGETLASDLTNEPLATAVLSEEANDETSADELVGAPELLLVTTAFQFTFSPDDPDDAALNRPSIGLSDVARSITSDCLNCSLTSITSIGLDSSENKFLLAFATPNILILLELTLNVDARTDLNPI